MTKTGAQDTNTPDPSVSRMQHEGPVPPILAASKPENSTRPRGDVASSQFSGPFGGKRPQS